MPLTHKVHEISLKTGAKGLIVDVPDSTVMSYSIHFRAGNDYVVRPEIHQTAHLMEHMAFGPNEQFATMEEFSQEFSCNGAYSNASTFDSNMHYYADCAQFEWDRILRLQQLAITKPKFLPAVLEAEKGNVREELTGQAHNNPRVMWQQINRSMGGRGLTDVEKLATIDNVTVEDIREHHTRTHTHKNMRFVLTGNFGDEIDKAVEILESWQLPEGERLEPLTSTLHSAEAVAIRRNEQENSNFGFVMVQPRLLSNFEMVTGSALNHILTGTLHSRIWGKARSSGICYGMGSGVANSLDGTSGWEFFGQVRPENAKALFELIKKELHRIVAGEISDEHVKEAKQYLTGEYQMRGQTVASLAHWYAGDYFFDDTIDPIDDAPKHIEAITKDGLISLAKSFIDSKTWCMGEIGSVESSQVKRHYAILQTLFS